MKDMQRKLVAIWCLLMLAWPVALFWMRPDFLAGGGSAAAAIKLGIVLAVANSVAVGLSYALTRRWSSLTKRFEEFIAAIPAQQIDLPEGGPPELESLSRAMKSMAERVRQIVEHAHLESSRRETILACMAEGVLAVDRNFRVVFCNDAFAHAFNARTSAPEGRNLYEIVREPVLRDILQRVLSTGTAETDRFQLPAAAGRWFEARALPLGEAPRRGAVIVLHDVTDIQRQEQVRKDFVADVSHELRTPLAAIRGYAETLLDGALYDAENNRKFVEIILSHAIRLNNIALDLLVLSELDSNEAVPLPPERIPVLDVIDAAVRTIQPAAVARGVQLDRSHCGACAVLGYRFRLEQVMINLLDNAVKFNRPEGAIAIECAANNGQVRISVADTGIGIPSDELNRIFERFYRVDKARSRPAGGTGLGLPIVKEVIDRMGGSVSVESQLGRGSRFTILLRAA